MVTGIVMPFQFGTNWSRFAGIAAANVLHHCNIFGTLFRTSKRKIFIFTFIIIQLVFSMIFKH